MASKISSTTRAAALGSTSPIPPTSDRRADRDDEQALQDVGDENEDGEEEQKLPASLPLASDDKDRAEVALLDPNAPAVNLGFGSSDAHRAAIPTRPGKGDFVVNTDVRVKKQSYIDNALREPGYVVRGYTGVVGHNLEIVVVDERKGVSRRVAYDAEKHNPDGLSPLDIGGEAE